LVCAKHVAQSNSRSVNRICSAHALLPKRKAARCKAGGFFVSKNRGQTPVFGNRRWGIAQKWGLTPNSSPFHVAMQHMM
jgi:hypothetical protein